MGFPVGQHVFVTKDIGGSISCPEYLPARPSRLRDAVVGSPRPGSSARETARGLLRRPCALPVLRSAQADRWTRLMTASGHGSTTYPVATSRVVGIWLAFAWRPANCWQEET